MSLLLFDILTKDGKLYNICNFDKPIEALDKLYSHNGNIVVSAIESRIDTRPSNLQLKACLPDIPFYSSSNYLLNAEVTIRHYPTLDIIFSGSVTTIAIEEENIELQIESIKSLLHKDIVQKYSKTCRASFCDSKCGLDKSAFTQKVSVESYSTNILYLKHEIKSDYNGGEALIFNGERSYSAKIIAQSINSITLLFPIPTYFLQELNTVYLIQGCNKRFETCVNKFNNAINFRGEPFIPELSDL